MSLAYSIDIVIPCHNVGHIVDKCINSVLNQNYTGEVNIHLVEDGSTDNTKEVITHFFKEKDISGEIFDCYFQNFGYNRTIALEKAKNRATYLLLLDADMKLHIKSTFDKQSLKKAVYTIEQGSDIFKYFNTRLVKGYLDITCAGPTHEYYDLPKGISSVPMKDLVIEAI